MKFRQSPRTCTVTTKRRRRLATLSQRMGEGLGVRASGLELGQYHWVPPLNRRVNAKTAKLPAPARKAAAGQASATDAKARAKIMIVDDHPMTRAGLAHLIK